MLSNRSIPPVTVIPVLNYADVAQAVAWLCEVFGFTQRLTIGNHRVQLTVGDGAVVAADGGRPGGERMRGHSVMVRVDDVDAHHERARSAGAEIVQPPASHSYGERQYTVVDIGGHAWTFTQSIADVDPADWGGVLVAPASG